MLFWDLQRKKTSKFGDKAKTDTYAQFWKKFFESSANVSLSTYEEDQLLDHTATNTTASELSHLEETGTNYSGTETETPSRDILGHREDDDATAMTIEAGTFLGDETITGTEISPSLNATPRPLSTKKARTGQRIPLSPLSALRREMDSEDSSSPLQPPPPGLQRHHAAHPPSTPLSHSRLPRRKSGQDPLLHRLLDKSYRVQATPLGNISRRMLPSQRTPQHYHHQQQQQQQQQHPGSSPPPLASTDSSPFSPPPQLNPALFSSPLRQPHLPSSRKPHPPLSPFRTPLASSKKVQQKYASAKRQLFSAQKPLPGGASARAFGASEPRLAPEDDITWSDDDDDDDDDAMAAFRTRGAGSQPETMQFHIPRSQVLRTPAREASRRIVDELLEGAGMERGEDTGEGFEGAGLEERVKGMRLGTEDSPTVVQQRGFGADDSF